MKLQKLKSSKLDKGKGGGLQAQPQHDIYNLYKSSTLKPPEDDLFNPLMDSMKEY